MNKIKNVSDLEIMDVIQYDTINAWRITGKIGETPKTITYSFVYERQDQMPEWVGRTGAHTFRKSSAFPVISSGGDFE